MTYDRNARQRERYATDPEYREKMLARGRAWGNTPVGHATAYERGRQWREANREHLKIKNAQWHATRMQKPEVRAAAIVRAHKGKLKAYGLTPEQFDAMVIAQDGLCLICRHKDRNRRLSVDHDHATGRVRGLLCRRCNTALGGFSDRRDLMLRAIQYLEETS